jgi:DNA (cytosine-5)-methyltransferase 1
MGNDILNSKIIMNHVDNPFKSPAVLSFCPGILGIERGLKRAGVHPRVMAYVEIEAYIIANLVAGMEAGILDPAPIWTDAKTFDASPFRGRIHGIIGGYPCPGESLAGLREGHLYKGFIWPNIRRAFAATRPLFGFFENVDDHLTGTYPIVQRSLQNMGYRVESGVYSAEEVGATHERQRLFILAVADSDYYGYGTGTGQVIGTSSQIESKAQRKEWNDLLREWMWDVVRNSGKELGNSKSLTEREQADKANAQPTEGEAWQESGKRCEQLADFVGQGLEGFGLRTDSSEQEFSLSSGIGHYQFPARPGEQQHDWEEPRTIDGYNFREDILRALGNSVVEQTAELAFIDLIRKHLKSL